MTYKIFEVKADQIGKINTLFKDEIINRQSILTRDSHSLNIDKDVTYVKVEGSKEGIKRAEELAKELEFTTLSSKDAKKINKKIEQQEDSAASGLGMIFD